MTDIIDYDLWDAPTDPKAAERMLIRLARATWRNPQLRPEERKYHARNLLNAARVNRAANGNTKKAQAGVMRALNLAPAEGRKPNTEQESLIYFTVKRMMDNEGMSREHALRTILATNHPCLDGYTGRSIENLRRVVKQWTKAEQTNWQ